MVGDPATIMTASSAALLGLSMTSAASLRAWRGWLDLKRAEVEVRGRPKPSARKVEVAELRERVRRLEAIASGIEI
jgi:hypothetical protein